MVDDDELGPLTISAGDAAWFIGGFWALLATLPLSALASLCQ